MLMCLLDLRDHKSKDLLSTQKVELSSFKRYPYALQMQMKLSYVPEHEFSSPHCSTAVLLFMQLAKTVVNNIEIAGVIF